MRLLYLFDIIPFVKPKIYKSATNKFIVVITMIGFSHGKSCILYNPQFPH